MKLFSEEALLEESRPLCDKAIDALDQGNMDILRFLLGRMSVGHFELYVGYVQWIVRVAGKILNDFGEPYFESTSQRVARFLMAPHVQDIKEGRGKKAVSELVNLWCHQLGPINYIGETEEEISFLFAPCGSGGRLRLESWYERNPALYPCTSKKTPVFCRICEHFQQAINNDLPEPFWLMTPSESALGHCRATFFKEKAYKKERLFSQAEIKPLITPRVHQALERLDLGQKDIKPLLIDQHQEWRPLHDLYCLWISAMFSLVYQEKGMDYLSELLWETYVDMFDSSYRNYAMAEDRSLVSNIARIWHYHQASFQLTEEEDRFVFHLDPCGSGGRLYRGDMGKPGDFCYGKGLLCEITEAADITFQRAPYPIYCIHCAATNRDQFEGKPWAFLVDGSVLKQPSACCEQYIYKKNALLKAPPHLPSQVGLDEAKPLQKEYIL